MKNTTGLDCNDIQKTLKLAAGSRVTGSHDGCLHLAARFPA